MSESRTHASPGTGPQAALEAALSGKSGDPLRRALWLDTLDRRLRPLLPSPLASHCRVANVRGEQLVFLVDAPVWRAKLRLLESSVLDAARSVGLACTSVAIKSTTTALPTTQPAPARSAKISATAQQTLRDALASLQDSGSAESATRQAPAPGAVRD